MSKSTPINQLPNILLNDPQRQVQQSEPVVQQSSPGVTSDEIIQETLNQLNSIQPSKPMQQMQQEPPVSIPISTNMSMPNPGEPYTNYEMPIMYDPNLYNSPPIQPVQSLPMQESDIKTKIMKDFAVWNGDLQVAIFAAAFYIMVSMLPIDKLVYRYVALEKIPYSGVVIKAVLMFVLIIIVLKFLKN